MHSINVLVVRCKPQFIFNITLGLKTFWRNYLTHPEGFCVLADPHDILQRVLKLCLGWPKNRRLHHLCVLAKTGELLSGVNSAD